MIDMTSLPQLMAGNGATTGLNGSYATDDGALARLNVTTTFEYGLLSIVIVPVFLINGSWVPQPGMDHSVYVVMSDGRVITPFDLVLDGSGVATAKQSYHGECLLADAGVNDGTTWKSHVTTSGAWEWQGLNSPDADSAGKSYYFDVTSEFDAEMKNGSTFQSYAQSADGGATVGMNNIITHFRDEVCDYYGQQVTVPLGPNMLYARIGDRVPHAAT